MQQSFSDQPLNSQNNKDILCGCGSNKYFNYISTKNRTLHCEKCLIKCEAAITYRQFQESLEKLYKQRKNNFNKTIESIEQTKNFYEKIFCQMQSELQRYYSENTEHQILYNTFNRSKITSLLTKLSLSIMENQEIILQFQEEPIFSKLQSQLQQMNLQLNLMFSEESKQDKNSWLSEKWRINEPGRAAFFINGNILIQDPEKNHIKLITLQNDLLYSQKFDSYIERLDKSPDNKIVAVTLKSLKLNVLRLKIIHNISSFECEEIEVPSSIQALTFNSKSNLIICSNQSEILFYKIEQNTINLLEERLVLDRDQVNNELIPVPVQALWELDSILFTINLAGTLKIYDMSNLSHIILLRQLNSNNPQLYTHLYSQHEWIFLGTIYPSIFLFKQNVNNNKITFIKQLDLHKPENFVMLKFQKNIFVVLGKRSISIYHTKGSDTINLITKTFEQNCISSCDISNDGTQLLVTGKTTVIYNLNF